MPMPIHIRQLMARVAELEKRVEKLEAVKPVEKKKPGRPKTNA